MMATNAWFRRLPALLAVALVAAACGSAANGNTVVGKAAGGHLTIAIAEDQPGSSLKGLNGDYSGFDIDVAQFVAKELGVDPGGITWRSTVSADRETVLRGDSNDSVRSAYRDDAGASTRRNQAPGTIHGDVQRARHTGIRNSVTRLWIGEV